jgi:hypothetical protein
MKIARATSEEATQAPSATEMKVMLVTHLQIGPENLLPVALAAYTTISNSSPLPTYMEIPSRRSLTKLVLWKSHHLDHFLAHQLTSSSHEDLQRKVDSLQPSVFQYKYSFPSTPEAF